MKPHTALLIALALAGCGVVATRGALAADTVQYELELDDCLKEARDAGRSLAVYSQCAHEADVRHGKKDGGV